MSHEWKTFPVSSIPQDFLSLSIGGEQIEVRTYTLKSCLADIIDEGLLFSGPS
jgi:hypothetical protein